MTGPCQIGKILSFYSYRGGSKARNWETVLGERSESPRGEARRADAR